MDNLDARILGAMNNSPSYQWDVRASFARIGKVVGVDPETVRARIVRMQDSGLFTGWDVTVNPSLLDLELFRIEVPSVSEASKDEAIEKLSLMEGAHLIFDLYRAGLALVAYLQPGRPLERTIELVASITDARAEAWPAPIPPAKIDLDATDWRIVQAMRNEPRARFSRLADVVGVSSRTVRRRVERLIEGRAVILRFVIDLERTDAGLATEVRVLLSDEEARERVVRQLLGRDNLIFAHVHGPLLIGSYVEPNLRSVSGFRAELGRLDGVGEVRCDVIARRITLRRWLDEAIETRASPVP